MIWDNALNLNALLMQDINAGSIYPLSIYVHPTHGCREPGVFSRGTQSTITHTYTHTCSHTIDNLQITISLQLMSLDWKRKLKYPEENPKAPQREHLNSPHTPTQRVKSQPYRWLLVHHCSTWTTFDRY